MATSQKNRVIQHLHRAAILWDGAGLTDGQLLTDYITNQDEAALAALVQRHGPMVWNVCRRVLGNHHDAEDAFQATFLVFVRRSASIASRELLANWLYGVAHQTALKARATVAKRAFRERQVKEMPEPAVLERDIWSHLEPLLDQELSRLPDSYRVVIILCDLEGKTRKEAAHQLALPEGTVASRLARARVMLAKRFTRHGLVVSGGAFATALAKNAVSAGMPNMVVTSTIKAATLVAAGHATAAGVISLAVAALTDGVLKAMFIKKMMATTMVVLALSVAAITGGSLAIAQNEGTGKPMAGKEVMPPAVEKSVEPAAKQDKEAFTAWGEKVGGLQAGIGFPLGKKRVYSHGETVKLIVRFRNVGKEEVTFRDEIVWMLTNPLSVTDRDGKAVYVACFQPVMSNGLLPGNAKLPPGKEVEYDHLELRLKPANERDDPLSDMTLFGTGKFQVQYKADGLSTLGKISNATGTLELEVKEAPAEKQKVLKPEEATRMKEGSKLIVEFKVESVTIAVLIKSEAKQEGWATGHGPDDRCLRPGYPKDRAQARFLAILTPNAITQLNKAGIRDIEKHFSGKTVRVTGPIVRQDYRGRGTPLEVEIVIDDLSQLEVMK